MTLDSLRLVRNILFRCLAVGVAFAFLLALVTFGAWDSWIGFATGLFHTDEAAIRNLVMDFFTAIRFFLLFIILTPALALHWTIKRDKIVHA